MGEEPEGTGPRERVERATERFAERRHAAAANLADRADAATAKMAERRDAAADAVATAKDSAAGAIARAKPRFRGVSHEWAFFLSVGLGIALISAADGARATAAASIYAVSLSALLGVSALYHRINWRRPEIRRWMRRLDHTMIFFLIAGTVTPFALLVMQEPFATALLVAVWAGAVAGAIVELIWIDAPKWVTTVVYLTVGGIGALGFPAIVIEAGIGAGILIAVGGALYTTGAVVYARQRPDPRPASFGYHEIFHVLVIAAAALHFGAVAFYALPAA